MPRDFFDPTPEQQNVVLINASTLREAERLIESCEHGNPLGAEIPFDAILDRVTGSDPSVTDYVLEQPAKREVYVSHSYPPKTDRRCDFCEFFNAFFQYATVDQLSASFCDQRDSQRSRRWLHPRCQQANFRASGCSVRR